jgi:Fe2+ or Zn2+ uptake regulation protein
MIIRKNTIQKRKILSYLQSVKTHPSAETIYYSVKDELPTITLATVYRNLNIMAEEGEILKLEINNEFRFDADTRYHQHCVCKNCNCIKDYFDESISIQALEDFESKDFIPSRVSIIYYGQCKNCRGKNDKLSNK